MSEIFKQITDMNESRSDLRSMVQSRIVAAAPRTVWTPADFLDLGNRDAVDKSLQRVVTAGELRGIDRDLCDRPTFNTLFR